MLQHIYIIMLELYEGFLKMQQQNAKRNNHHMMECGLLVAVVLWDIFANKFSPCNKNKLSSLVFALLIRSCPMHHRALQLKQTASLPLHWKIYCAICFDCDAMYRPCTAFPYITDALYYNILLGQCSELWIVYFSTVPNQLSLHLLDCTSMLVLVHCLCLIWLHCNGERLLKAGKTM